MKTALTIWGLGVGATFVFFGVVAWRTRNNPTPLEYGEQDDEWDDEWDY